MTFACAISKLLLIAAPAVLLSACSAFERQAPISQRSISQSERIILGGWSQAIRIRGDDCEKNPVLLFVHGGPGLPEMPLAHLNADLERYFTVVQWDQRGAGKSYSPETPNLNAEQIVRDTLELSRELRRRFGGRKIYLVGFSWGSLVSARAAARAPELFEAYVGISQLASIPEAEATFYRDTLSRARREGVSEAVRDLERSGPPPWPNVVDKNRAKRWWKSLPPPPPNKVTTARLAGIGLTSPAYSFADFLKITPGGRLSFAKLEGEIHAANLFAEIPRLELPVVFLAGRHDTVVNSAVIERYFKALKAPRGKRLVWFEKSDHAPHLEEPAKFRAVMEEIRTRRRGQRVE